MVTTAIPTTRISGGGFLLEERKGDEVFTPEDFTEQHQLIGQTAEEFAINEIVPNIEKMEHKDFSITRDLLKKAGELGLSSAEIPEAYGGLRCLSCISGLRSRRKNICRGWLREKLLGPTLCPRLLPDPMR